jgi:hypothetical protein
MRAGNCFLSRIVDLHREVENFFAGLTPELVDRHHRPPVPWNESRFYMKSIALKTASGNRDNIGKPSAECKVQRVEEGRNRNSEDQNIALLHQAYLEFHFERSAIFSAPCTALSRWTLDIGPWTLFTGTGKRPLQLLQEDVLRWGGIRGCPP